MTATVAAAATLGALAAFRLCVGPALRGQERLMTRLTLRAMAPTAPEP